MYMYYALVDRAPEAYGSHLRVHVCLLVFDSALIILLRHMISLFFYDSCGGYARPVHMFGGYIQTGNCTWVLSSLHFHEV